MSVYGRERERERERKAIIFAITNENWSFLQFTDRTTIGVLSVRKKQPIEVVAFLQLTVFHTICHPSDNVNMTIGDVGEEPISYIYSLCSEQGESQRLPKGTLCFHWLTRANPLCSESRRCSSQS